jgi:hypothetical protein
MSRARAGDKTGILTIRVWHEHGQFRARIRWTSDIDGRHEMTETCDSADDVTVAVRRWLASLDPPRPSGQVRS